MNDQDPSAPSENRLSEPELFLTPRTVSPGTAGTRTGGNRASRPPETEPNQAENAVRVAPEMKRTGEPPALPPKQVKILVRVAPAEAPPPGQGTGPTETTTAGGSSIGNQKSEIAHDPIPARMMNEFVYCQRLFYYEFVEGVFIESADTLRGGAIHQRVDSGSGSLPAAKRKSEASKPKEAQGTTADAVGSAS
jgi:hypothetical protein